MKPQMQPMSTCYPCGKLSPVGEIDSESLERKCLFNFKYNEFVKKIQCYGKGGEI